MIPTIGPRLHTLQYLQMSLVHGIFGFLLIFGDHERSTAMAAYAQLVADRTEGGIILLAVSMLALVFYTGLPALVRLCAVIPQLCVLIMSALSAGISIASGTYPDGTKCCSSAYIMEDQVIWVVLLLFYLLTFLRMIKFR